MPISSSTVNQKLKPAFFVILFMPAMWLAMQWLSRSLGLTNGLGFNPIEYTNRYLGDWALRILILALAMRPMQILSGSVLPIRLRRMTGLIAFTYVSLHVSSYLAIDLFFDWQAFWKDVLKRNFITLGMINFTLLLPLVATSNKRMVKRLGGVLWQRLHRVVYVINILAVIHFMMMVKGNQLEPKIYMGIVFLLLGIRVFDAARKKRPKKRRAAS